MSNLDQGRDAPINYVAFCNNVADSYPQSIAHGLQKDAVQNSLDARKGQSTVRVEFSVVGDGDDVLLIFKDTGTTGLTGNVIENVEDYENLRANDHWARFEGLGYTKDDPDALGARGQGKFIFLCASKQHKMFYDTLRDDGIYRLGATEVTTTRRTIYPQRGEKWEGETAKARLSERLYGLDPLEEVGTRIIVCDPIPEVLEEIKNGDFVAAIQDTWFRAIEKNQLEVWLDKEGNKEKINLPRPYPLLRKDDSKEKTWIYKKDFADCAISADRKFNIKNFHAVYLPDMDIPEELQGIAIVQNGMKITSLNMEIASSEVQQKITGFIEFDKPLDRELRKGHNQHPNHYQLKWRSTTPRNIKAFINRQLSEFGRKKLGIGEDKRERQKRHRGNAERKAMEQLLRYAPDMDLRGSRNPGPGRNPPGPPSPPSHKKIGISLQVQFPDDIKRPRVDWGEEILVSVSCFNKTENDVYGQISIRILQADTTIEELLVNTRVELSAGNIGSRAPKINNGFPYRIELDSSRYKSPGEYRIRATLINRNDGETIDRLTRKFWLTENPPSQLPFQLVPSPLETKHAWLPSGDVNNDPTIYYNTNHPQYRQMQDDEDEQADYLFNICLEGVLHFMLIRADNAEGVPDYHPLNTQEIVNSQPDEMPEKVYKEVSRYIAEVRWRMFEAS